MRIYACGCSFTYGDELKDPSISAWPVLLANKLQASIDNDAIGGGTNYRTAYHAIKNIKNNYDLYLIAWTDYSRYTFYRRDDNFETNFTVGLDSATMFTGTVYENIYKKWGGDFYRYWYNELYAFKIWLQQIIQLQSLLEKENKKYIMINTMHNNLSKWLSSRLEFIESVKALINFDSMNDKQIIDEHEEIQYYISLIDTSKFYQWNNFEITQLCEEFDCGPGHHILEEGHAHLAELIYHHVQNKISHS
jgi:hypothetical protein